MPVYRSTLKVEGYESAPEEDMNPNYNAVSPGYFRTLEIPLLEGRTFTEADANGAAPVGIVNESFVEHFFPGESPPENLEILGFQSLVCMPSA